MRDFFIDNALYWLEEFHFDGLRLDAVHAIVDDSEPDIVMRDRRDRSGPHSRPPYPSDPGERPQRGATPGSAGAGGTVRSMTRSGTTTCTTRCTCCATGQTGGYYADYADDPIAHLGRALAEGFAYQGEPSPYRDGRPRGEPSGDLPATAFVSFLQNHDQIGNTPFGERITALRRPRRCACRRRDRAAVAANPAAVHGRGMGERPAVPVLLRFRRRPGRGGAPGRAAEFASFPEFRDEAARARIPDPLAEATFLSAKLDWPVLRDPAPAAMLTFYRELIALRRRHIAPLLADSERPRGQFVRLGSGGLEVRWRLDGAELTLLANLSGEPVEASPRAGRGRVIYQSHEAIEILPPRFVSFTIEQTGRS